MTNKFSQKNRQDDDDHALATKFLRVCSLFGKTFVDFAQILHHSESSFDAVHPISFDDVPPLIPSPESSFSSKAKFVHFDNENVLIHEIDHLPDEKRLIWYRSKELKRIRKEGQETLQLLREGALVADTEEHCLLGLNSFSETTHPYAKQRSLHKMLLRDVLMEEQRRQWELGSYFDDESLGAKVRDFSSRCRHAEFVSGLRNDRTPRQGVIN